jgi:hypothetical protein
LSDFQDAINKIIEDGEKRGTYTRNCPSCGGDVGGPAYTYDWNNMYSECVSCGVTVKMGYSGTYFRWYLVNKE